MKYPDKYLVWPLSKPEEIYLHLAEGGNGKEKLSQDRAYQGHAVLRMCSDYDDRLNCGSISCVAERRYQLAPIGVCGFTLEDEEHALVFHVHYGPKLEGALEAAMMRIFPDHAGLLEMTRLDDHGSVLRSGMSANAAVEHPFFQGLVGLRPQEEAARFRMNLREVALEVAGLPPMGPTTRARVWDFFCEERADQSTRISSCSGNGRQGFSILTSSRAG